MLLDRTGRARLRYLRPPLGSRSVDAVSLLLFCASRPGDRRNERLGRMLRADRTVFSRGVALSGEPAATWLEALCRSPDRRDDLRLAADIYRSRDLALARLWTSASTVTNADSQSEGVSITVLTEGEMVLRAGGDDHVLEKGDAVLYRSASLVSTASTAPSAVIEIELGRGSGDRVAPGLLSDSSFVPRTVSSVRPLSVLVNEILAGLDEPARRISRRIVVAVEALAADLVEDTDHDLPVRISPSDRRLIVAARRTIRCELDDRGLSIATLAKEMSVTQRRLQMAFASLGTTPVREIRMRRADAAEDLLRTYSQVGRPEMERVARQVGLPNARALRDLLVAFERTVPGHSRDSGRLAGPVPGSDPASAVRSCSECASSP
ncbi:hypothetical protein [Rathayibacter tritici]|uniref:AraC-like ligand-binding domain-containing protein n=1 Tax=Rathayibacter tritici TaxID=33888 RepID=UPI0011B0454E|nr:hypothetical protein [Rathayibacter tritici]